MSKSPEARLSENILRELNALPGALFLKRPGTGFGPSGLADITGCIGGVHVEIEVKKEPRLLRVGVSGGVRPKQHHWLLKWQDAGARVGTAASVNDAVEIAMGKTRYTAQGLNISVDDDREES